MKQKKVGKMLLGNSVALSDVNSGVCFGQCVEPFGMGLLGKGKKELQVCV